MPVNEGDEWNPKGESELVADPMLVEIDEIEPRDGSSAPVDTPVGRKIAAMLIRGDLDGPISDEVGAELRQLGPERLRETGIDPVAWQDAYFKDNPEIAENIILGEN